MLGTLDPLADGQQGGELVAGPGRIPRLPGPAGELVAGGQGVRVLGALDPLADGQQGGTLVAGPGRIPRLPGPAGELVAGGQGIRVLGAQDPLADGQQGGNWSRAPAASPASPVQRASWLRAARVSGCSGPRTRSRTGSRAAN